MINIGPGASGGRKRRSKKGNLPSIFDDDCSYANALSPVETVLGHFLWDLGPMNVTIKSQKSERSEEHTSELQSPT